MSAAKITKSDMKDGWIVFVSKHREHKLGGYEVLAECPICHKRKYIRVAFLLSGHTKTTRCRKCYLKRGNASPITKEEITGKDFIVFLDKQKLFREKRNGKQMLRILSECPDCHNQRWIRVNSIRNNKTKTSICNSCSRRRQDHPFTRDGIMFAAGYKMINVKKLSKDDRDLVCKSNMKLHRGYVYEHRLNALKKFGNEMFDGGIVVRHIDGNKLNNHSDNIMLGKQSENIRDHMTANNQMKVWRSIALTLFRMLTQ